MDGDPIELSDSGINIIDHPSSGCPSTIVPLLDRAMYVAEGVTPLAALRAATLNPAKLIHGTDSLGALTQGKPADFVDLSESSCT